MNISKFSLLLITSFFTFSFGCSKQENKNENNSDIVYHETLVSVLYPFNWQKHTGNETDYYCVFKAPKSSYYYLSLEKYDKSIESKSIDVYAYEITKNGENLISEQLRIDDSCRQFTMFLKEDYEFKFKLHIFAFDMAGWGLIIDYDQKN